MIVREKGGGTYPQCPTGIHAARCFGVVDIGTQTSNFEGRSSSRRQVVLMFEMPNALIEEGDHEGEPFALSNFYTASLHKKAKLRADLESWRGRPFAESELEGFDLKVLVNKTCTLNVVMNEDGKSRIGTVMVGGKEPLPPMRNEARLFDLDNFSQEAYNKLPEWLQKMIAQSPEFKALKSGRPIQAAATGDDIADDGLPF